MGSALRGLVCLVGSAWLFGCEGVVDRLEALHPGGGAAGDSGSQGLTDQGERGSGDDEGDGVTDAAMGFSTGSNDPNAPVAGGTGSAKGDATPQLAVTLDVRLFTVVVGGSAKATAEFTWDTQGSPAAAVTIEMKSSVTHPQWTPLLTGLPASDVGALYELPLVRQTLWFRAVAADGSALGTSAIVRFD